MTIKIITRRYHVTDRNIVRIYSEKEDVQIDPSYQREGDIWNLEKKQLLIDSIINDLDIPKIYFHEFNKPKKTESGKVASYAIIDGKQRLTAIWDFMENKYPLGSDFIFLKDQSIKANNLSYNDLGKLYPKLKINFDSYSLPIIAVVTEDDDIEPIEEMFSRLNEAVPLSSAEKRNAMGGYMVNVIRDISKHAFFKKKIRFPVKRLQHMEEVAKCLLVISSLENEKKICDTKKVHLDNFVKEYKSEKKSTVEQLKKDTLEIIKAMEGIFLDKDELLSQSAMIIYFLLFKRLSDDEEIGKISRSKLKKFVDERKNNRRKAEANMADADYALLEYDRLSVQGTNDASSIMFRLEMLYKYIRN